MKDNKQSIDFYKKIAKTINSAIDVKLLPNNDNTKYDIEFIRKYISKNNDLLDLGSGTGLIINELINDLNEIVAVEFFKEFSSYIKHEDIEVINTDIISFRKNKKFDIITMFGTAHHFNEDESLSIYKNIFLMLKSNGKFILKNQFGINETKTVTSSDEIGDNYYAQYRFIDFEIKRLNSLGFKDITVHDIYPEKENRWKDTHFYALVCGK